MELKLSGQCNLCGLCCFVGNLRCENLEILTFPGMPFSTRCRVYAKRYDMMPIRMLNSSGEAVGEASCAGAGTPLETLEIMQKGIGKGCSLKVETCGS